MHPLAEIRSLIARHTRPGEVYSPFDGMRLIAQTAPTVPTSSMQRAAFALVAQGVKRTVLGDNVYEYGAGDFIVVPLDVPVVGQVVKASSKQPYLAFVWDLQPALITSLMLEGGIDTRVARQATSVAVSHAPDALLDPIARLLRLLDQPQDVAILRPMLEREIAWRILTGEQGGALTAIGLADSQLSRINRALLQIRTCYADTLRIEDLAATAAMSVATFHRHFRAITALSPLQFQKQVRLHEARAKLMAGTRDVASVGFEVGYQSPSQFSREYARFFGVRPLEDLKQSRSGITFNSELS
ncbi:AraC family transcriptional regulator N-terminal domain-containing protein [Paraburkholderia jirisanensis]